MAEIRAEAARIVSYHQFPTWEPPQDLLRAQFYYLELQFLHHRVLDEEVWLSLAEGFERRHRPYAVADAHR